MFTRRRFAAAAAAATVLGAVGGTGRGRAAEDPAGRLADEIAKIESASEGRLGVAALGANGNALATWRADERFPMCSTYKALAAAAILARVDAGEELLSRRIRFEAKDLLSYAPVAKEHVGADGMTMAELCEAAVTMSDNTAANLIVSALGGPSAVTRYVRSLGDEVTRLDRIEPDLNEATPGDPRDTTTPAAMAKNLQSLALGGALSAPSRDQLVAWLVANKTGDARLRAGLPKTWRIGDKTGGGGQGTSNDIAVAWPPERSGIIIVAYLTQSSASDDKRNAALAAVGRAVATAFGVEKG